MGHLDESGASSTGLRRSCVNGASLQVPAAPCLDSAGFEEVAGAIRPSPVLCRVALRHMAALSAGV
jgi:hypothetical protein